MNNVILKCIVGFFLISTSFYTHAQTEPSIDEIKGSYTIYVKSVKKETKPLNEDQLLQIESLRKDSEDFKTSIGDIIVLIMSREKMENGAKWANYTILNK